MYGGGFVHLPSHSRLTMPCCQSLLNEASSHSVGDVTDGGGIQPAGLAAAAITSYSRLRGHINLCGIDHGLLVAASPRRNAIQTTLPVGLQLLRLRVQQLPFNRFELTKKM